MSTHISFQWKTETLHLYANGSLYLPDYDLIVISDLHLEKGAAQSSIVPLPAFDTQDTLQRAAAAISQTGAKDCIFLGDSFHTTETAWRLPAAQRAHIQQLSESCTLHWVEGNHDPDLPKHIPGNHCAELAIGPIEFRHMPIEGHKPEFEIIGHYHPKARLKLRAKQVSGKCFFQGNTRLLMPAFGTYTGGLNVKTDVISGVTAGVIPNAEHVFFCHQTKIYKLPFIARKFM